MLLYFTLLIISTIVTIKFIPRRVSSRPVLYDTKSEKILIKSIIEFPEIIPSLDLVKPEMFSYINFEKFMVRKDEILKENSISKIPEVILKYIEERYTYNIKYNEFLELIKEEDFITEKNNERIVFKYEEYEVEMRNIDNEILFIYKSFEKVKDTVGEKLRQYLNSSEFLDVKKEIEKVNDLEKLSRLELQKLIAMSGVSIMNSYEDRTTFNGESKIISQNSIDRPLIRLEEKVSGKEVGFILFTSLIGGLVIFYKFQNNVYILGSISLLLIFSILWSYVDIKTMYLDTGMFYLGSLLSSIPITLYLFISNDLRKFISPIIFAVVVAIILEFINWVFNKLRGVDGLGFGDIMILFPVTIIPSTAIGSWILGYNILMYSFLLGIAGFMVRKLFSGKGREIPFAFGPYLAIGWVVGLILPSIIPY